MGKRFCLPYNDLLKCLVPGKGNGFSPPHHFQTTIGVEPRLVSNGYLGTLPRCKTAGCPSSAQVENKSRFGTFHS
jgi:hypothetical protein